MFLPGTCHQLRVAVIGEDNVRQIAVTQRDCDEREVERGRQGSEGLDERAVELGLGRRCCDDFEMELEYDRRRRREVVWEVIRACPHDTHTAREQRERQLGVAVLKQMLDVALWEVHDSVIQLRQEGEGGLYLEKPRTVVDAGGVGLQVRRRA